MDGRAKIRSACLPSSESEVGAIGVRPEAHGISGDSMSIH
jgi:hypothetical protein